MLDERIEIDYSYLNKEANVIVREGIDWTSAHRGPTYEQLMNHTYIIDEGDVILEDGSRLA